jgi:hypothetical protein
MKERTQSLRRDINDLVRDDTGHLSPTKIGVLVGQWLAVKLILENGSLIIANWDSLTVLFSVLIAPGMFIKLVNSKYGGNGGNGAPSPTVTTTTTETETKTSPKFTKRSA